MLVPLLLHLAPAGAAPGAALSTACAFFAARGFVVGCIGGVMSLPALEAKPRNPPGVDPVPGANTGPSGDASRLPVPRPCGALAAVGVAWAARRPTQAPQVLAPPPLELATGKVDVAASERRRTRLRHMPKSGRASCHLALLPRLFRVMCSIFTLIKIRTKEHIVYAEICYLVIKVVREPECLIW